METKQATAALFDLSGRYIAREDEKMQCHIVCIYSTCLHYVLKSKNQKVRPETGLLSQDRKTGLYFGDKTIELAGADIYLLQVRNQLCSRLLTQTTRPLPDKKRKIHLSKGTVRLFREEKNPEK